MAWSENEYRDAHEIEHHRRHVQHVVGPVTPAGKKSVKIAEDFLCPEIDPAFTGIAVPKFDDSDSLRPKEQQQRNNPQPNRNAAIGRDAGDYIQIEYCHHKKQHEIAAS